MERSETKSEFESEMFLSAEDRARVKAERDRVLAGADEARTALNVREKKGALSMTGIFCGFLPQAARAAATASAGQGGGGGGAAKKDPPKTMKIILVDVADLASVKVAGYNYEIISPTEIALPAHDSKLIKAAGTTLTAAVQAVALAKNAGPGPTPEQLEALATAQADVERAAKPVAHVPAKQGQMTLISWFASGKSAADLKPGCIVKLMGVEGDASYGATNGQLYLKLKCDTPLVVGTGDSAFVSFGNYMDIFQQPVRQLPPGWTGGEKYGESMVMLFSDYVRSEQDTQEGRGPVAQRMLVNSQHEKDWQFGKDTEEKKMIAVYTMYQKQDASVPGFPANTFTITATIMDGDWSPEGQSTKNTLRAGLGFTRADIFAKIMCANPVPALMTCSTNMEKTMQQRNAGNEHVVATWGDNVKFLLREYLLSNCPRVSWKYLRKVFQIKPATLPDEAVSISKDDPSRPCQLNRHNQNNQYVMINDKVLNISSYTGNLWNLAEQGCEWRVMTSSMLDPDQRAQLASMSTDDAEKVLDNSSEAPFLLPGEGLIKVYYAVIPMSADEAAKTDAACNSWKARRATQLARKEAAANMVICQDEEDQEQDQMQEEQEEPSTGKRERPEVTSTAAAASAASAAPAVQKKIKPEPEPTHEQIGDDEMAAIAAAEEAAYAAAAEAAEQKVASKPAKRERPVAAAAADQQTDQAAPVAVVVKKKAKVAPSVPVSPSHVAATPKKTVKKAAAGETAKVK